MTTVLAPAAEGVHADSHGDPTPVHAAAWQDELLIGARPFEPGRCDDRRTVFDRLYSRAVADGDDEAGRQLAELLIAARPSRPHPDIERAFVFALRKPWVRPQQMAHAAVDYLLLDPNIAAAVRDEGSDAERLSAIAERLCASELFETLLQTSIVDELRFQRLLIALRDRMASDPPSTPSGLKLAALLATQTQLVEYLWPDTRPTAEEASRVRATGDATADPVRALVNAIFRPPTSPELTAIQSLESEPAVSVLLARIRDEPAREDRYQAQVGRSFSVLGTAEDRPGCDEDPYPRWIGEPIRARAVPPPVRRRMCAPRFERPGILVVGCRTGRDLFSVRATHSNAHITALDRSTGNLAYAIRKCNEAEMYGIEFIAGDLLDVPPLGWTFDFIECPGGMSRLPEPNEAVEALARCTTPGSVLRLEVCSDGSRRVANALQSVARERGLEPTLSDLRTFRNELVDGRHGALPQVLLESPEFHTASGLRSILFDANEPMLDAPAWIALVGAYGFDFLCAEANDVLLRAASAAGYASAADWSLRDWERFERTHPAEFGGRYSLWFARE